MTVSLPICGDRIFVSVYVEPNQIPSTRGAKSLKERFLRDQKADFAILHGITEKTKMPDVDLAIVIRHLSMCSSKD
ncbi:MAG: hypothetical protein E6L07_00160 [Verrucomicrobia bacterium]|nr:MAG: hypothetical protein E6L07_00160 [Verrucomicrobiota bacterium]